MESEKINSGKMDRKKFFSSIGIGMIGYFIVKSLPFGLMGKRVKDKKVYIEIYPDAVRRTNKGEKNG
jgi:hypothetical protein